MNHETIITLLLKIFVPIVFSLCIFFKFIYPVLVIVFNLIKVFFLLIKEGILYLYNLLKVHNDNQAHVNHVEVLTTK